MVTSNPLERYFTVVVFAGVLQFISNGKMDMSHFMGFGLFASDKVDNDIEVIDTLCGHPPSPRLLPFYYIGFSGI